MSKTSTPLTDTHGRRSGEVWQTVKTMLDISCQPNSYGRYSIEWAVQDGVIQTISTQKQQYIKEPKTCKTKKPAQE